MGSMTGGEIAILATSSATLLLNIFQSVKSDHFKSSCCGGFIELSNVFIGKDSTPPAEEKTSQTTVSDIVKLAQ